VVGLWQALTEMKTEAGNYSAEELKQFREVFAADLKQNQASDRKYSTLILVIILAGFAAVICSYVLSQPPTKWLLIAGIALIAGGLVLMAVAAVVLQKQLKCPACHNVFIAEIGECCPECGSAPLERGGLLDTPHCNSCGKDLRGGKTRNFRYKACTHCGVFLYDKGL
jgi:hypothetical protein